MRIPISDPTRNPGTRLVRLGLALQMAGVEYEDDQLPPDRTLHACKVLAGEFANIIEAIERLHAAELAGAKWNETRKANGGTHASGYSDAQQPEANSVPDAKAMSFDELAVKPEHRDTIPAPEDGVSGVDITLHADVCVFLETHYGRKEVVSNILGIKDVAQIAESYGLIYSMGKPIPKDFILLCLAKLESNTAELAEADAQYGSAN